MRREHRLLLRLALCMQHRRRPRARCAGVDAVNRAFRRILVISTTAIGDTLLSTPIIQALREIYPKALIKGLFRHRYSRLFAGNPHLNGIIAYRHGWLGLARTLCAVRRERFEAAFVLHTSDPRPVGLAALAGIPFVAGKSIHTHFDPLFDVLTRPDYRQHAIERRMAVLKKIHPQRTHWPRRLVLPLSVQQTRGTWRKLASEFRLPSLAGPVVGFQLGASREFKIWPQERFAALGRRLLDEDPDLVLLLLGSAQEIYLAQAVKADLASSGRVFSFCGKLRLEQLPHIVAGLTCLVTNDTGTLHIAIAVGTSTISLFAATDPHGTGPYQDLERHVVVAKPKPCGAQCVGKQCPYTPSCMHLISVEEVYREVSKVLAGRAQGANRHQDSSKYRPHITACCR